MSINAFIGTHDTVAHWHGHDALELISQSTTGLFRVITQRTTYYFVENIPEQEHPPLTHTSGVFSIRMTDAGLLTISHDVERRVISFSPVGWERLLPGVDIDGIPGPGPR